MATRLVAPDGRVYVIEDDANAAEATKAGWRPLGQDETRTWSEAAKGAGTSLGEGLVTGAEGVLRGATAGLSDVALTKAYAAPEDASPEEKARADFNRTEIARRKEEHPWISGAGDLAGMVASPLSKIAPVEGVTALGRIGAGAVNYGIQGGLYGAGNTLSESALGDTQLTAEKLVAGTGLGALLGMAGGGLGATLEEGVKAAIPAAQRGLAKLGGSALEDFANDSAVKSLRSQQGALNRMKQGGRDLGEVGQVLRDRGIIQEGIAPNPEELLASIQKHVASEGAVKGGFIDLADKGAIKPDFNAALGVLDKAVGEMSPLEREAVAGPIGKARTALEDIATDPALGTWRAFDKWKQDLQAMAKFSRGSAEDDLAMGLKRKLSGVARAELDRQLVPALGADGQAFLKSKQTYGALKDAERLATSGAGRTTPGGVGGLGLYDLISGGIGAVIHPALAVAALGSKFIRERGPALTAQLADKISQSPALKLTAASFAQNAQKALPHFGQYAAPLAQALGQSPELGLATHLVYAQAHPDYAEKAQQAGFLPETPEESGFATAKANGLVGVAAALKNTDDAIDRGIDKVFKASAGVRRPETTNKQDFGAKRMRTEGVEAHQRRMDEVTQLAADPNALLERVTKNIGAMSDAAPGASAAAANVAHRAVTYLAAQIQKPVKPGPLAQDWHFNDTELFKFSKKLEAVQEPLSILEHGAAGTLTKDQVEAVKAVYPTVWAQMRDKALEKLAEGPKGVPYKARLMLNTLTGIDPDGTFGQAVSKNQAAMMAATEKPSEQMGSEKSPLTVAQDTATTSQRREMDKQS